MKLKYTRPQIKVNNAKYGISLMISISGETTPEDSEAKNGFFQEEDNDEKNQQSEYSTHDIWENGYNH